MEPCRLQQHWASESPLRQILRIPQNCTTYITAGCKKLGFRQCVYMSEVFITGTHAQQPTLNTENTSMYDLCIPDKCHLKIVSENIFLLKVITSKGCHRENKMQYIYKCCLVKHRCLKCNFMKHLKKLRLNTCTILPQSGHNSYRISTRVWEQKSTLYCAKN